eukprot:TRINITY_DN22602_c0_g1_i2.p1 TRINITY_DN22602_c0_g1~~TRINITY_DN22602_c0_g1_i2.p1  ORF type:complete len:184 (-),score=25.99 TRINITY_DN22602_c0_g1_i2:738-1289(-)
MLILEQDAMFIEETVHKSLSRADAFLHRRAEYDVLFLGWYDDWTNYDHFSLKRHESSACIFEVPSRFQTHAYIISSDAMARWRRWQWRSHHPDIDVRLNEHARAGRHLIVRPACTYQACHENLNPWPKTASTEMSKRSGLSLYAFGQYENQDRMEHLMCDPLMALKVQDNMYAESGLENVCND